MMRVFSFLTFSLVITSIAQALETETVTVTAQRSESLEPAVSISSVRNNEDTPLLHIHELMTQSPSTWISKGNGQEHLTAIRSPVFTGTAGCASFIMSEDNIPLRSTPFCNVNQLMDVNSEQADRVEVLRGPGTAFHGSGALHGVINVISPSFSEQTYTRLAAEYENTHDYGRLIFDHRNSNHIIQGHFTDDNGYKDDSGFTQQKLRYKYKQEADDWTLIHNINASNLEQQTAGFVTGTDAYKVRSNRKKNLDPDAFRNAYSVRYHAVISRPTTDDGLFVITPYLRTNDMEFLMHFQPGKPLEESGNHSAGFQSAYTRHFLNNTELTTGFDIDYSTGYLKQYQNTPHSNPAMFPTGEHYDFTVDVLSTAMYFHSNTHLHERLALILGTRLEYIQYDYNNKLDANNACAQSATCRYSAPDDAKKNVYHWSPRVALNWQWLDQQMAFINITKAHRAPHTHELFRLENGQRTARIDAENVTSIELGFSGNILNTALYQLSFYAMEKDNVIFKDNNRQNVDNQKTEHYGAELSLAVDITRYVTLSGNFSYGNHQYASNHFLSGGTGANIKGNMMDTAPRHLHQAAITIKPVDISRITFEAVYMGRYYLDPENLFSYDGHTLYNLRYQQFLPDGWELGLGIYNLDDTLYADRADVLGTTERYFIGEPRSTRLSIAKQF